MGHGLPGGTGLACARERAAIGAADVLGGGFHGAVSGRCSGVATVWPPQDDGALLRVGGRGLRAGFVVVGAIGSRSSGDRLDAREIERDIAGGEFQARELLAVLLPVVLEEGALDADPIPLAEDAIGMLGGAETCCSATESGDVAGL